MLFRFVRVDKAELVELIEIKFVIIGHVPHALSVIFIFLFDFWEEFFDLWPVLIIKNAFVKNGHTVLEHVVFLYCNLKRGLTDIDDYPVVELNDALVHMVFINSVIT